VECPLSRAYEATSPAVTLPGDPTWGSNPQTQLEKVETQSGRRQENLLTKNPKVEWLWETWPKWAETK